MVSITRNSPESLNVKLKNEFCRDSKANYIQKIITFKFQHKLYLAISRKSGLIQLYEKCQDKRSGQKYYQLFKEWKNSNFNNQDQTIALGFFHQQYLYSCSNEGKLILRDLVNDDADESYKVYVIHGPVADIQFYMGLSSDRITVASAGKNCELKLYEINSSLMKQVVFQHSGVRSAFELSNADTSSLRPIRRSFTGLNLNGSLGDSLQMSQPTQIPSNRSLSPTISPPSSYERSMCGLTPFWNASTNVDMFEYNALPTETISSWIVSICMMNDYIFCGTQFGKLLVYEIYDETIPKETLQLSHFPITNLTRLGNSSYVLYTDSMSKVGIIDTVKFEVVKFYDNLKIGPLVFCKFITSPSIKRSKRKARNWLYFDPIYVLATTIDKSFTIYKLYDDNTYENLINTKLVDSLIPSICVMGNNEYGSFHSVFGSSTSYAVDAELESQQEYKKRKLVSPDSLHHALTVSCINDGIVPVCSLPAKKSVKYPEKKANPFMINENGLNESVKTMTIK